MRAGGRGCLAQRIRRAQARLVHGRAVAHFGQFRVIVGFTTVAIAALLYAAASNTIRFIRVRPPAPRSSTGSAGRAAIARETFSVGRRSCRGSRIGGGRQSRAARAAVGNWNESHYHWHEPLKMASLISAASWSSSTSRAGANATGCWRDFEGTENCLRGFGAGVSVAKKGWVAIRLRFGVRPAGRARLSLLGPPGYTTSDADNAVAIVTCSVHS